MSEKTYEKKVGIRDIVSFFQLEQLTGDDSSLDRWTVIQDLNRPGFELAGVFKSTDLVVSLSSVIKNQSLFER